MKELIELAKEKGFESDLLPLMINYAKGSNNYPNKILDTAYYLYLCEFQKWLRDEHKIYVVPLPNVHCYWNYKITDIQCDPSNHIKRDIKEGQQFDVQTPESALLEGLKEALKYI